MSTWKKSGGAKQVRFPDFDAILGAIAGAYAMIDVSLMAVSHFHLSTDIAATHRAPSIRLWIIRSKESGQ
jgi:hypothetical protein